MAASATATYGKLGLGFLEARVIHALGKTPGTKAVELRRHLGVDRGQLSRTLKGMRAARLIVQVDVERRLCLSEKGRRLRARVDAVADARERRLLQGFSDEEAHQLTGYLLRMLDNTSELSALASEVADLLKGERKPTCEPRSEDVARRQATPHAVPRQSSPLANWKG